MVPSRSLLHRRGFTLVEMMIAVTLLAVLAFATVASLQQAARVTRLNSQTLTALQLAHSEYERLLRVNFADLGPEAFPDHAPEDDPPLWIDEAQGIRASLSYDFSGYGELENSSRQQLTDARAGWEHNIWQGATVFLVEGEGAGQMGRIASNTPNTLHLETPLAFAPRKGTRYMIDHGKTVTLTLRWQDRGRPYEQKLRALVVNDRQGALGF